MHELDFDEAIEAKKIFCSNCGQKISKDVKFCTNCGVSVKKNGNIKIKNIKCPNCQADVQYQEDTDKLICSYCRADLIIDDDAAELNRILTVKGNAKQKYNEIHMEYEKHQQAIQTQSKIRDFILKNPIFCLVAVFCLIYALLRILKGDFAGIDIIMHTCILYFVYRITNKRSKE